MRRIFIKLSIFISLCLASLTASGFKKRDVTLVKKYEDLFSHKNHLSHFQKSNVSCVDCHSFSVKSMNQDPLGETVGSGFLKSDPGRCHDCHMGRISQPIPNQCALCHREPQSLMPPNHYQSAWPMRHGRVAQSDGDSCKTCHQQNSCTQCHTQKNTVKPIVHSANFRMTHSIEARANPQSCVSCHSTPSTCIQCHTKGGP
jgi:hypothetical protein